MPSTEHSARGASARRRGHTAERSVARWLRDNGYPDAHTTRGALGHDGTKQPGDCVGPVGVVISVKDVAASAWPTWIRQAEDEADGRPWVVVRRTRGVRDVALWPCRFADPATPTVPLQATFGAFVRWLEADDPNEPTDLHTTTGL